MISQAPTPVPGPSVGEESVTSGLRGKDASYPARLGSILGVMPGPRARFWPRIVSLTALAGLAIAGISAEPQTATLVDPKLDRLASLVTAKMAEYHVPGVAFGVVKDGRVFMRGFGVTNVEEPRPITPDTVFGLASI